MISKAANSIILHGKAYCMNTLIIAVALLFLSFATSNLNAGKVYTWTDENGILHITDQPPPEGTAIKDVIEYDELMPTESRQIESQKEKQRKNSGVEEKIQQAEDARKRAIKADEQAKEAVKRANEIIESNNEYIRNLTSTKRKRKQFRKKVERLMQESQAAQAQAMEAVETARKAAEEARVAEEEARTAQSQQ
jgi:hypothetical protein